MTRDALPNCPVSGFHSVEILGSGGNGDVIKIANNETGEEFALKILREFKMILINDSRIEVDIVTRCGMRELFQLQSPLCQIILD